jgi:hypothetical protein
MIFATLGVSILSVVYGLLISVFMIGYFSVGEKIQLWSEKYTPPRNWIRRVLHLCLCLFVLGVFFYSFLFWISVVLDATRQLSGNSALQLITFFLLTLLLILPFFALRKHILRKFKVRKLWE